MKQSPQGAGGGAPGGKTDPLTVSGFALALFEYRPSYKRWLQLIPAILWAAFEWERFWRPETYISGAFGISHFWLGLIPVLAFLLYFAYPSLLAWGFEGVVIFWLMLKLNIHDIEMGWDYSHSPKWAAEDFTPWVLWHLLLFIMLPIALWIFVYPRKRKAKPVKSAHAEQLKLDGNP